MKFDLERYKVKLLEMMKVFDAFCREHQLRYSLCAGSLLGAVRHHNIIPWDDDIDVMMPRPDYERLLELSRQNFPAGYSIIYFGNASHYYLPLAKMTDLNTCLIEFEYNMECPIGVNIDIFPIDVVPESEERRNMVYSKFLHDYEVASVAAQYAQFTFPVHEGKFRMRTLLHVFRNRIYRLTKNSASVFAGMDAMISETDWNNGKKCRIYSSYQYHKYLFDKEWFEHYIDVDFGGLKVRAIKKYDDYLKMLFHDYMKLPPKEKQVCHHHHYFLDLDRGYSISELKQLGIIKY